MSNTNPAKKKKTSGMFKYDAIKASARSSQQECVGDVQRWLSCLKEVDLSRIMEERSTLTEEEAIQLLAIKLSMKGLDNLRKAVSHVPGNITRVVNGKSMRLTYIFKILENFPSHEQVSYDDFVLYMQFIDKYCSVSFPISKETETELWKLTEKENVNYNKFLTPPVSNCIHCEKLLTVRNNPCKVKLFTLDGTIPCTKITLECRDCSFVYGVSNYADKEGTHLYPIEIYIERPLIEVSNVTYFDHKLYKWFPALR